MCYRSSGWSLCPRVRSNDQTTYEPVTSADMVQVDGIVFCEVQTSDRFFAYLVKNKYLRGGKWIFHNLEHAGLGERLVSHRAYVRHVDRMYLVSAAASALRVVATASAAIFARE